MSREIMEFSVFLNCLDLERDIFIYSIALVLQGWSLNLILQGDIVMKDVVIVSNAGLVYFGQGTVTNFANNQIDSIDQVGMKKSSVVGQK